MSGATGTCTDREQLLIRIDLLESEVVTHIQKAQLEIGRRAIYAMAMGRLQSRVEDLRRTLYEIGFMPDGSPIMGTSNKSAKKNFENNCRLARKAIQEDDKNNGSP